MFPFGNIFLNNHISIYEWPREMQISPTCSELFGLLVDGKKSDFFEKYFLIAEIIGQGQNFSKINFLIPF